MSNRMNSSRISAVMTLTLGILVMTLASPAMAICPTVSVVGTSVSGGAVNVTVKNYTLLVQSRTVNVQAVVNGSSSWSSVTVTLLPLQSATVSAGFVGLVANVLTVGMTDDGVPY